MSDAGSERAKHGHEMRTSLWSFSLIFFSAAAFFCFCAAFAGLFGGERGCICTAPAADSASAGFSRAGGGGAAASGTARVVCFGGLFLTGTAFADGVKTVGD